MKYCFDFWWILYHDTRYWSYIIQHTHIFSSKSDSTFTNVRPFVRLSVCHQNLKTAWNHHPSSFFIHPSFISRLLNFSACCTWMNMTGNKLAIMSFQLWTFGLKTYNIHALIGRDWETWRCTKPKRIKATCLQRLFRRKRKKV